MKVCIDENEVAKYVNENYDLEVVDIKRVKNSYKVQTVDGAYCLKAIEYNFKHFIFIISAINHIQKNNFQSTPNIIENKNKKLYGIIDNKYVYLTRWIPSRIGNFDNPIELRKISEKLGEFHRCSKNFVISQDMEPRIGWFSWIKVFETRLTEIIDFKKRIEQKYKKSEFDYLFLENIEYQINIGNRSIDGLKKNNYYKVMEQEVFKGGFCHHDYAHHNILIDDDNNLNVIDFDYCILDTHIHDLCSLLIRCMKDKRWSYKKADIIMNSYEKAFYIKECEIPLMREFIRFPQNFWQIGLQKYWEQQPWEDEIFINKLKKYLDDCNEREEFINSYFKGGD